MLKFSLTPDAMMLSPMQNENHADELRAADISTVYVERLLSFSKMEYVEEKAFSLPQLLSLWST
jgi:hypothetical protein